MFICGWGEFRDLGTAQPVFDNGQQIFSVGCHKSIIADFDESFWQDMLQEAVDKIKSRQGCCFPLIGGAVFKPEADLVVFELFDAVIGDSRSVDIRGQVF